MGLLLKCEHVGFGYENQDAVLDVNLEVNEGDYYLGYQGIKEGMDYFTTCRIGGEGWGKSNYFFRV